jgi:hypothetical protein
MFCRIEMVENGRHVCEASILRSVVEIPGGEFDIEEMNRAAEDAVRKKYPGHRIVSVMDWTKWA